MKTGPPPVCDYCKKEVDIQLPHRSFNAHGTEYFWHNDPNVPKLNCYNNAYSSSPQHRLQLQPVQGQSAGRR